MQLQLVTKGVEIRFAESTALRGAASWANMPHRFESYIGLEGIRDEANHTLGGISGRGQTAEIVLVSPPYAVRERAGEVGDALGGSCDLDCEDALYHGHRDQFDGDGVNLIAP